MALSNDLISQFVKVTQDKKEDKKESTAYGKIVKQGDVEYVQLDGSDLLTPISSTTVVKDGDRVMVTIKNHTAIVTGDLSNPSANDKDVKEIGSKISEFEIIIADKISTKQLEAEIAKIDKLIADNIEATNGKFETIEGKVAEIDTIKADVIEVEKKVTAHEGEFTTLRSDIADFKDVTAERVDAVEGNFHTLESDYADFKELSTNKITANEGAITELETKKLDTETANIKYASIDFSNIGVAAIEKLFSDSGIIKDLIMSDGKVTGELVGVTIKGDLIEGNTLKADKLVILGEDGLYYKLNVNALGEATASSDEKYQNGLDGSVIVAESITAEKISVDDLVAFGATIGGYHIDDHALYSGAKSSIDNTTQGVFLGDDGQMAVGDSNNYLKFFVDENGEYKLEIKASSFKLKTGETIEEYLNNLEVGESVIQSDTAPEDTNAIWYDTTTNQFKKYDGTEWIVVNDWTGSVNDLNTEINNTKDNLTNEINDVNDNINQIIEEYKVDVNAEFEQTKEGFSMTFTELIQQITNVDGTVNANYAELRSYIDFEGGVITLGESNNPLKLVLDNDRMSFTQDGDEVAYISDNKLYIHDGEFLSSLKLGRWVWIIETDGGLSLNYV